VTQIVVGVVGQSLNSKCVLEAAVGQRRGSRISRQIWLWYLRADGDGCVNIGTSRIPRGKKSQH